MLLFSISNTMKTKKNKLFSHRFLITMFSHRSFVFIEILQGGQYIYKIHFINTKLFFSNFGNAKFISDFFTWRFRRRLARSQNNNLKYIFDLCWIQAFYLKAGTRGALSKFDISSAYSSTFYMLIYSVVLWLSLYYHISINENPFERT